MKTNYDSELASDIHVGCVVSRWEEFSSTISAAAYRAGIHLGRGVAAEPMHHRNPNRYDVVLLIGTPQTDSLNKCAVYIDLDEIGSRNDFDAVEKLADAITIAVCGLSLQALSVQQP